MAKDFDVEGTHHSSSLPNEDRILKGIGQKNGGEGWKFSLLLLGEIQLCAEGQTKTTPLNSSSHGIHSGTEAPNAHYT